MIKARHHILHPTSEQCDLLKQVQQEAAACWNAVVAEAKAHYDAGGGWISKNDLQKRLKGRFALHSQTVQGLVDRYLILTIMTMSSWLGFKRHLAVNCTGYVSEGRYPD